MIKEKELTYESLIYKCDDELINDRSLDDLDNESDFIGQDKALEAFDFGVKIKEKGYNLFLINNSGLNKLESIEKHLRDITEGHNAPDDWCYVYNFENPMKPKPIRLKAGLGKVFKKDMKKFIDKFSEDLARQFSSVEFELQKNKINEVYKEKNEELLKQIKNEAEDYEFDTQVTEKDIYFIPILDEEKLSEEMFDELSEEQQDSIIKKSEVLQEKATQILKKIKYNQTKSDEKVDDLKKNITIILLRDYMEELTDEYGDYESVLEYLNDVQNDIVDNIDQWINNDDHQDKLLSLLPSYKNNGEDQKRKYNVKLLVDNSDTKGAPVICGFNPSFYNLLGKIEHESENIVLDDITTIRPGLLHKANGGYLILEAEELLTNTYSWYALKLMLKSQKIFYKQLKETSSNTQLASIDPLPIPLELKIILVGSSYFYNLLYYYENSFKHLFKLKIFLDHEIEKNIDNQKKMIKYIKNKVRVEGFNNIDKEAVYAILRYSSRMVMNIDKLVSSVEPINDLLVEAFKWANEINEDTITKEVIEMAIKERNNRVNYLEGKIDKLIDDKQIMIDVVGEKIGQINALAVIDVGDYTFAKPTKITATTFRGQKGIINIENEADMSGKVHNKGVHILSGYLGYKYAQRFPLSLSCQICFEQNYSMVDGDSASSSELYAVLSSISKIPIKQNIAVTGSINQFGEIQPIGGATYKVEGFFNICKRKGLDGSHGVIIPHQNIKDLVLNQEVLNAVKEKKFHIYAIESVDEGIEILTGVPAKRIHETVYRTLKRM